MTASTQKTDMVTSTGLADRGWSRELIDQFLPEPDMVKRNPVFRSAAPMRLYALKRVKRIERTKAFIAANEKMRARRLAAVVSASKRAAQLAELVANIAIPVAEGMSRSTLVKRACTSYNDHKFDRYEDYAPATPNSDTAFLDRICVNYLRHDCTDYDAIISELHGKVGRSEAYEIVRNRVLTRIAEVYPYLAAEAERQKLT